MAWNQHALEVSCAVLCVQCVNPRPTIGVRLSGLPSIGFAGVRVTIDGLHGQVFLLEYPFTNGIISIQPCEEAFHYIALIAPSPLAWWG